MLSYFPVFIVILFALLANAVRGFLPANKISPKVTSLQMLPQAPPPALERYTVTQNYSPVSSASSPVQQGVESYLSRSSSVHVALQERKVPTKEEIEAKKRNFNVIFWGGGFVAPFLATILYVPVTTLNWVHGRFHNLFVLILIQYFFVDYLLLFFPQLLGFKFWEK